MVFPLVIFLGEDCLLCEEGRDGLQGSGEARLRDSQAVTLASSSAAHHARPASDVCDRGRLGRIPACPETLCGERFLPEWMLAVSAPAPSLDEGGGRGAFETPFVFMLIIPALWVMPFAGFNGVFSV